MDRGLAVFGIIHRTGETVGEIVGGITFGGRDKGVYMYAYINIFALLSNEEWETGLYGDCMDMILYTCNRKDSRIGNIFNTHGLQISGR